MSKVLLGLVLTYFLSYPIYGSSKITADNAQELVQKSMQETNFPIELNANVLSQLNKFLANQAKKDFMRKLIEKKKQYDEIFAEYIKKYNVPSEILAIALVESGFENHKVKNKSTRPAGIWQFVPMTARSYGLKVNSKNDEREDVSKSSEAAIQLLNDLNQRFGDWRLAIIAYNTGAERLNKAMKKTGSRDAWELSKLKFKGDPNYLAKVMAGVILLKNPHILN
jgi:membrane-bound lytic murein transglycosylase D